MDQQLSFSHHEYAGKKNTRRERFLQEMEAVVPWARLRALTTPHYPDGKRGRPPVGVERMLRLYFLQQWYALADEALEDALDDSHALRTFARIDLSHESVPDATTQFQFRRLLDEVTALLTEKKLILREGTLMDATIMPRRPPPRTAPASATPPCTRPGKASNGISG